MINFHKLPFGRLSKFVLVGGVGFLVDAGILTLLIPSMGLYIARIFSFLTAVTITWLLNRYFTFGKSARKNHHEWLTYTAANSIGAFLNFSCYAMMVSSSVNLSQQPVVALAIASMIALFVNFSASEWWVFKR